jgi:azurin
MSRRTLLVAALGLAATLVPVPAHAATEFQITVDPDAQQPAKTFDVTGDAVDPICAEDGVAVSLTYTKPNGSNGHTTVNTTTDTAGHFAATLTVPDDAVAGEAAQVRALIADCTPESGPSEGARSSEAVAFDVLAYEGTFKVNDADMRGKPGETITFSGTNCWGGDVVVVFGDDEMTAVLKPDKTFSGSYVLPDAPDGTYEIAAQCPGTDFEVLSFRLDNPAAPPPVAPPATPVPGRPRFTG